MKYFTCDATGSYPYCRSSHSFIAYMMVWVIFNYTKQYCWLCKSTPFRT